MTTDHQNQPKGQYTASYQSLSKDDREKVARMALKLADVIGELPKEELQPGQWRHLVKNWDQWRTVEESLPECYLIATSLRSKIYRRLEKAGLPEPEDENHELAKLIQQLDVVLRICDSLDKFSATPDASTKLTYAGRTISAFLDLDIPIEEEDGEDGAGGEHGRGPAKEPSKEATKAYCLYYGTHYTQEQVATIMSKELDMTISQGQVSKWIKEAKAWRKSEGLPVEKDEKASPIKAMDPERLDLGPRTDGRRIGDPELRRDENAD